VRRKYNFAFLPCYSAVNLILAAAAPTEGSSVSWKKACPLSAIGEKESRNLACPCFVGIW
jgi:hypothetical protein